MSKLTSSATMAQLLGFIAATVSAVSYTYVDTAGGGQRVVATVSSSVGCTAITIGGVACTSFAIDDATHVSGIPGAHAAGVVDVVVTNVSGSSTGGTGLIEYWIPTQITSVAGVYDSEKGITTATGVSAWTDQSAATLNLAQATGANQPAYTASAFGTLHGLTFSGAHVLTLGATAHVQASGRSVFWVGKYTSTQATHTGYAGDNPLTVVGDGTGNVNVNAGHNAGALSYQNYNAGWIESTAGSALNDGVPRLFGWEHDTSGNLSAFVGNTQQGATITGRTYNTVATGWSNVGQGFGGSADGYIGVIGAIVIVDAIITAGDLTKLNAWARQRFGTP